jgi:ATP-binding cassette subfamily C (CFTR/MRP) protein 1
VSFFNTQNQSNAFPGRTVCPEFRSSIFSRLCFNWMNPLMAKGYQVPLAFSDVWKLEKFDRHETVHDKLTRQLKLEMEKAPEKRSLTRVLFQCWGREYSK